MTIIGLYGFVDQKPFRKSDTYHRFAAVICARNERTVIGHLIESVRHQHYPQGLIGVIVVADNCTDDTAAIARKAGAIVYERHNLEQIGKGYALRFFVDKVFADKGENYYDAFCFFDADNIVHPDYFEHMNRALAAGANVAQGYRDMKNPTDTWISGTHSVFYWIQNRFGHNARYMLGLNAVINGTGFMMRASKPVSYTHLHRPSQASNKFHQTPSACNKLFRRALVADQQFLQGLWYEDFNFTTKLLFCTDQIGYCAHAFYHCHCRLASTMTNHNAPKNLDILTVLDDIINFAQNRGLYCRYQEPIEFMVLDHVLITSINRVAKQTHPEKNNVIRKLRRYVLARYPRFYQDRVFTAMPRNRKLIAWLNAKGLHGVSKILLNLSAKTK